MPQQTRLESPLHRIPALLTSTLSLVCDAMEQLSPQLMNRLVFAVIMHGLNDSQTQLAVEVLGDAIRHPNPQIRELAVVALSDLPVAPAKRVTHLLPALDDKNAKVKRRAARALGDQGPAAQVALAKLIENLTDEDASVRRDCAGAISRMGAVGAPAVPKLTQMLTEPEYRTRAVASVALKRIGVAAVPGLIAAAQSDNPELRGRCAVLLAYIAPDDDQVNQVLNSALTDEDSEVRAKADEALTLVNTPAPHYRQIKTAEALVD